LPVVGASIAGDTAGLSHLQPGFAAKIMTGAPLPEGADTILPVERASWDHEKLTFYEAYPLGKHVRLVGQDVKAGATILRKGQRLVSQHVPMLCALGLNHIKVYQPPRISWISTGQEISDDFDQPLAPGHIYNATGLYGKSFLAEIGLTLDSTVTVRDTPQDFAGALEEALSSTANIIISTGGVSAGQYDFVRPVLEDFGAEILVHKARIKPGKPILFAKLPGNKFFFGLPGNPISTALGLRVFVYPFIRKLTGLPPERAHTACLAKDCTTSPDRTTFLMANVQENSDGLLVATPNNSQQSFQTAPFAHSNAWLISPENISSHDKNDIIRWLPVQPKS
ncbi:MAG: molybdopterin molybdotransferase MoeA, partial [Kordiimonas sp.]